MTDISGKEIRTRIAQMLDACTANGYSWKDKSCEDLAADLCDHDEDLASWDRVQLEYWVGDFLA